jgi:hypothetical protein
LPAPYGFQGFAAPVEQVYPIMTPELTLADDSRVIAGDGADAIEPASDGMSLRARWTKWAVVGRKSGELQDVGLTSEVTWRIHLSTLTREETLTAKQPVTIRRWWLVVPTSHEKVETQISDGVRTDRFSTRRARLEVKLSEASFPVQTSIRATGDSPMGKGVHRAIPLYLMFDSQNITVTPEKPLKFKLTIAF